MNSLAGANAAIVADVPGTTRDVVYSLAKLGDREVRLADTAGIEPGRCDIERRSQEQARAESSRACMRLWCVDSSRPDFLQAITNLRQLARLEEKAVGDRCLGCNQRWISALSRRGNQAMLWLPVG